MIVVIVGPLCSGKNEVGEIFTKKGFEVISTANLIRADLRKEGIEITRENLQNHAREMRKKIGESYPANKIADIIQDGKNYVVQDPRNPKELEEVKKLDNCYIIAVDAPRELRFERMSSRKREKDPTTFEEFKKIDDMELYGTGAGGFGFNIKGCMDMADILIINDGSLEELHRKMEEVIEELG